MEYSDFIESIEEELTEEDMDPPCPIKCDKRVNPNAERDAAIARKAREDVLDEIAMHGNYLSINALSHKDWNHEMRKYIQSLRQQQGGQEQPR